MNPNMRVDLQIDRMDSRGDRHEVHGISTLKDAKRYVAVTFRQDPTFAVEVRVFMQNWVWVADLANCVPTLPGVVGGWYPKTAPEWHRYRRTR